MIAAFVMNSYNLITKIFVHISGVRLIDFGMCTQYRSGLKKEDIVK
jgi:uncharacterized membrane protein